MTTYIPLIPITDLTAGSTCKGSDTYVAVDTTDTTMSPDGTTKKYILSQIFDYIANGLGFTSYKNSIAATTANLNATYDNGLSGVNATLTNAGTKAVFTIDGVTLSVGDRVLIKNQTSNVQNGIYVVSVLGDISSVNWVLTRATDFNSSTNIVDELLDFVYEGTVNVNTLWVLNVTGPVVVGTTPIVWTAFSLPGTGSVNTGLINQLAYYAAAGNVVSGLTTANGGVLVTSSAGVPSILAGSGTTGTILRAISGGTPAWSTATYPSTITINTLLYASATNVVSELPTANSRVLTTSVTGVPTWDTSLPSGLTIPVPNITGVTNASNATAGSIGQYVSAQVLKAAPTNFPISNTLYDVMSISLTAGDWDVSGNICFDITVGATILSAGFNSTSATLGDLSLVTNLTLSGGATVYGMNTGFVIAPQRFNLAAPATIYMVAAAVFGAGAVGGFGQMSARRVR